QPGETANLEITIKDPGSGKPVAGAWCQTDIVDESLYSILSAKIPDGAWQALWKHPRTAFYTSLENRVNTRFTFSDYYHPDYSKMKFFDGGGMKIADRFMNIAREGLGVGGDEIHRFYAAENDVFYGVDKNQGKVAGGSKTAFRIPVRSDFKDALAWQPHLLTDASGKARFSVKLSDDLTTWRVSTTVFDRALDFGQVHSNFRVSRDFIATLALPRFYTKGDETAITALVHNLTDSAQKVNLSLDTSEQIQLNNYEPCALNLAAGESIRHGWPATIKRAGQASLKLTARGASVNASDAVAQKIPVNDLGYRMYLSSNGILKDEMATVSLPLKLPNGADLAASSLRLELAPSLIGPVTGGYENLIQYPYGCTEQTLSRLIPSVVARRLKNELALHLSDAMEGKFDVIRTKALTKLKESQNVDGGWGWFKASKSDIYMTAQVMEGLYQMKQAGFKMIGFEGVRANGLRYLESAVQSRATLPFDSTTGTDMARAIYVLSLYGKKLNPIAKTNTFLRVDEMPPEALSYLALAFKKQGEPNLQIVYERLKLLANEDIRYTHYDHTERMLKMLDGGKGRPNTYRYTGVETTALAP
ncbi:MAG TPA: alpha-2-macroglobulin family protein, partial [Candidatus Melainabacteria bacterium]|nr:alpha-2-macroglobulin family protein [Candidatus Melainabacteria bacterium]